MKGVGFLLLLISLSTFVYSNTEEDKAKELEKLLKETAEKEGDAYRDFLLSAGFVNHVFHEAGVGSSSAVDGFANTVNNLIESKRLSIEKIQKGLDTVHDDINAKKDECTSQNRNERAECKEAQKEAVCRLAGVYGELQAEAQASKGDVDAARTGFSTAYSVSLAETGRYKHRDSRWQDGEFMERLKWNRRLRRDGHYRGFFKVEGATVYAKMRKHRAGRRSSKDVQQSAGKISEENFDLEYSEPSSDIKSLFSDKKFRPAIFGYYSHRANDILGSELEVFEKLSELYGARREAMQELCDKFSQIEATKDEAQNDPGQVRIVKPPAVDTPIGNQGGAEQSIGCFTGKQGSFPTYDKNCDCKKQKNCFKAAGKKGNQSSKALIRLGPDGRVLQKNLSDLRKTNEALSNGNLEKARTHAASLSKRGAITRAIEQRLEKRLGKKDANELAKASKEFGKGLEKDISKSIAKIRKNRKGREAFDSATGGAFSSAAKSFGARSGQAGKGSAADSEAKLRRAVLEGGKALRKGKGNEGEVLGDGELSSLQDEVNQARKKGTLGSPDDSERDNYSERDRGNDDNVGDQISKDREKSLWKIINQKYEQSFFHRIFKKKSR